MRRREKKKSKANKKQQLEKQPETKPVSKEEIISSYEPSSENIIRLKLTTRKGTRIESVPAIKLKKLAKNKKLYWKLEDNWLILIGFDSVS